MASDRDGIRVTATRHKSPLIPAVLVLGVLGWLVARTWWNEQKPRPTPMPPNESVASYPVGAASLPVAAAEPSNAAASNSQRVERARQRREERQVNRRAERDPPFTANLPGETAGIAAFPPPGTKPIKRGIIVPDDFELPPGYVRHYQSTDDGHRLPPILMFHPDFAGVDESGNPIVVPEDRIVPPELAPPGLPIRTLDGTTDVDDRVGRKDHTEPRPGP